MKSKWIEEGYSIISQEGFEKFNVELLARKVNKSKSSFYYHFHDLETFRKELLNLHIERTRELANKSVEMNEPGIPVLKLFISYKVDFLFHKQLRIKREDPLIHDCILKTSQIMEPIFLNLWIKYLGLEDQSFFAKALYDLVADNFFLRITEKNFDLIWLLKYVEEISTLKRTIGKQ